MPNPTYDAIVIGGGHNGLVAAAYLAKAGYHTLVLERYHTVGGAAFSQEIEPGFLLSEGSYVLSLMPRSIIDDLDAWGGIQLIGRDPRFFMPFPDGRALTAWEDHDKFIAEIARFSERDAKAYDHYDAFVEKAATVMDRYILSNPPSFAEFASNFKNADEARIFQKMILGSAAEVAEYFFESEQVQAMACAFGLIGTFRAPAMPEQPMSSSTTPWGMSPASAVNGHMSRAPWAPSARQSQTRLSASAPRSSPMPRWLRFASRMDERPALSLLTAGNSAPGSSSQMPILSGPTPGWWMHPHYRPSSWLTSRQSRSPRQS
ncbi:MAG: NAD(P)/FAD-dependent oxidoreductase [Thermomicrobiales bacterium]